ncbi:hypothetical protein BaRGS_00023886 [Batillaria attramentaria]|uniref:Uncharacterized protein n=1 Tax=Batillaria attramentaria TaxID=370345 RepID=A0ABD0KCJ8_9CAEN
MANWAQRSPGYKLGLFLLFVASLLYVIGYAAPYWKYHRDDSTSHWFSAGLWTVCGGNRHFSQCIPYKAPYDGWMNAVRAVQCLGIFGLALCFIYAFVVNCCQTSGNHSYFLEVVAGLSGVCGFIGTMIYVAKMDEAIYRKGAYSWAFGLDLTGCILIIITSVILFFANKPLVPPVTISEPTAPPAPTTIVTHGQCNPPPAGAYPMHYPPGTYPQAGVPPQGYPAQYPRGNVQPMGYSGGMAPNSGYSENAPPPAYDTVVGYRGNMYSQGYSAHNAPHQGYPTDGQQ